MRLNSEGSRNRCLHLSRTGFFFLFFYYWEMSYPNLIWVYSVVSGPHFVYTGIKILGTGTYFLLLDINSKYKIKDSDHITNRPKLVASIAIWLADSILNAIITSRGDARRGILKKNGLQTRSSRFIIFVVRRRARHYEILCCWKKLVSEKFEKNR